MNQITKKIHNNLSNKKSQFKQIKEKKPKLMIVINKILNKSQIKIILIIKGINQDKIVKNMLILNHKIEN